MPGYLPRVDLPVRCGDCGAVVQYEVPESAGLLLVKHNDEVVGAINAKIITRPCDILFGTCVWLRQYHQRQETRNGA